MTDQIAELKRYSALVPIVNEMLSDPIESKRFKTALAEIGVEAMAESLFELIEDHGYRAKPQSLGTQLNLF